LAKAVPRNKVSDVRGVGKLAVDAALGLTSLVENLHHNIARASAPLGVPVQAPMAGISGLVYRSIRGATRMMGGGIDLLLGQVAPLLAHEPSSEKREAVLAALNGVLGDHLALTGNPLATPMQLRRDGRALELTRDALSKAIAQPRGRVVVLVHGLCFNDLQWRRKGHDHGAALARDAPPERALTQLYLHYNSGRHVSTNGRALAETLEALCKAWPVALEELTLIGHSMGGLVARSACAYGAIAGHGWPRMLRKLVFLGTPHEGAPLERGGNWVNLVLDASPYTAAFARLGKIRSAGITDLRHGSILDDDWVYQDRFRHAKNAAEARTAVPLPAGVECYAIAGSVARGPGELKERLVGDGLVPLDSALGHHAGPEGGALFARSHESIAHGVNHLGLLNSTQVYRQLQLWLE
jgi:pimeloyl-ACP methyl ester carboxylesterase